MIYIMKVNQIFHYTRSVTPKRVTSLRSPFCIIALAGNAAPFEEMTQLRQAVRNSVSDLTGRRFEPHTSRSRDVRVIAQPQNKQCSTKSKIP